MKPDGGLAEFLKQLEILQDKYDLMVNNAPNYSKPKTYSRPRCLSFIRAVTSWTLNNHCAETREPYTHENQIIFEELAKSLGFEVQVNTEDEQADMQAEEYDEFRLHQFDQELKRKHLLN